MRRKDHKYDFHHALNVQSDKCTGCTHCITACPTEAIRIRDGIARIMADRCVDCGECYKACPVSAIVVEQDDLELIFKFPVRVILIPNVLIGQFSHKIPVYEIYRALGEIGFTHVFHVESTVDMVLEAYKEYAAGTETRPLISSFCPAIVRLIQVRFPSLVNNIVRANPPIDMSAIYYRQLLKSEGYPDEHIGLFYATPCAAKITAIKSPVGEIESGLTGVINMDFLYNKIRLILEKSRTGKGLPITNNLLNSRGILWSLTRGEADHSEKRALAVDGIKNVTEILESLENGTMGVADFLELRACDEGCAGGILTTGNRFLTVERLRKMAADQIHDDNNNFKNSVEIFTDIKKHSFLGNIEPRNIEKLDEDLSEAMKKMERIRRMMCFLPGFDCGACGAPRCQTLAEDIVLSRAGIYNCIFMQQMAIKSGKLSLEKAFTITEKIWGEERLEKNCNKPGAEDENF
ncbi:MAG TPA: [Fe-Fe] hydrogenase large subunit C-terminal domain-containing protein [Bacteroidales bacterium]|nr:[Fe-Fe] hydrogenase large subunit C-terminal domain-containing protein [Bacteroidales bacterium]